MGHGWKSAGTKSTERPCKCGKGEIITSTDIEESDYPPFERESFSSTRTNTCPDKCE